MQSLPVMKSIPGNSMPDNPFNLLKQAKHDACNTMPAPSNEDAPEDINVYTDGSWLYPLKQYLGLGGAGV